MNAPQHNPCARRWQQWFSFGLGIRCAAQLRAVVDRFLASGRAGLLPHGAVTSCAFSFQRARTS
jgi:hypothetical protein